MTVDSHNLPRKSFACYAKMWGLESNHMTDSAAEGAGINVPPAKSNETGTLCRGTARGRQQHQTCCFATWRAHRGSEEAPKDPIPRARVPRFPEAGIPKGTATPMSAYECFSGCSPMRFIGAQDDFCLRLHLGAIEEIPVHPAVQAHRVL
jgi:hypothetical protein